MILFCLGLIAFSLFGRHGWLQLKDKRARYDSLQKDIDRIKKENQALKEHIEKLEKDPATMEQEIRRRMMYAKPGETVYQVTDQEDKKK